MSNAHAQGQAVQSLKMYAKYGSQKNMQVINENKCCDCETSEAYVVEGLKSSSSH